MPRTRLVLYCDADGKIPLFAWFDTLAPKERAKCGVRLERLAELGHELRRPEADYLRDGIHELRVKHSGANHRMLYFFHAQNAAVVTHGFSKRTGRVPPLEIELARSRKRAVESDPATFIHQEDC
jgi:phage-related protein